MLLVWLNWLMEGFFCKYFSFSLPCSALFDWIDLWRFYSNNSWRFPWDGFVCKNIISFVKWDEEKILEVGHIHMIRDNKGLACPSTYLIHFSYLLTISMFLIAIFPNQRIRVSKNVFSITFTASLYGSPSMFFLFELSMIFFFLPVLAWNQLVRALRVEINVGDCVCPNKF